MPLPHLFAVQKGPLISSRESRNLLMAISTGDFDTPEVKKYHINNKRLLALHSEYTVTQQKYKNSKRIPQNLAFYDMLKKRIPELQWQIIEREKTNPIVNFNLPLINNLQPSLASLLLGNAQYIGKNKLHKQWPTLVPKVDTQVLTALNTFFANTDAIYPTEYEGVKIIKWLTAAKAGKPSTLFLHTCPDYSVEPTGDDSKPYKHNFKSLGNDIGQIALRILNTFPELANLFNTLGIAPRVVVTIADYEALSAQTCRRVGESKTTFLRKVRQSLSAFQDKSTLPCIEAYMTTELFSGGEKSWTETVSKYKVSLKNSDLGAIAIGNSIFDKIACARKALYSKWFDSGKSTEFYSEIALSQAAEYAAIGCQIAKSFQNCLVLGADSNLFGPFYSSVMAIPTVYLKRRYS